MAKANTKNEKFNGKIAGLTALQVIFYLLSIPVIVVLAVVFGIQTYQLVPYYSFWPFVGTILAGVLCLVFMIVVMCITLRKKSKRTVLMQTVSIVIAAVMLTSFIAVMLDIVLPDVLAQLTSSTLFYDDLENADQANFQIEGLGFRFRGFHFDFQGDEIQFIVFLNAADGTGKLGLDFKLRIPFHLDTVDGVSQFFGSDASECIFHDDTSVHLFFIIIPYFSPFVNSGEKEFPLLNRLSFKFSAIRQKYPAREIAKSLLRFCFFPTGMLQ